MAVIFEKQFEAPKKPNQKRFAPSAFTILMLVLVVVPVIILVYQQRWQDLKYIGLAAIIGVGIAVVIYWLHLYEKWRKGE